MKTALFSPSSWLRKSPKQDQPEELPLSRSPTPTRFFSSSARHRPVTPVLMEPDRSRPEYASLRSKAPPRRPPRPPSLDLIAPPTPTKDTDSITTIKESGRSNIRKPRPNPTGNSLLAKRSMPELDGVWKGFLEDVDEDFDSLHNHPLPKLPPIHQHSLSVQSSYGKSVESDTYIASRNDNGSPKPRPKPRPTLHSSKSAHNITTVKREGSSPSPRSSTSSSDSLPLAGDFASLFPAPPPLIIRKKTVKPLVLYPRSTTAPSRSSDFSSSESTPVATPTTPSPPSFRQLPPSPILKKFPPAASVPSSPVSPYITGFSTPTSPLDYHPYPGTPFLSRPPRMVHTVSSPSPSNLPMSAPAHRSTSSDTTAFSNSNPPRNNRLPPVLSSNSFQTPVLNGRRQASNHSNSNVQWGIAV